MNNGTSSKDRVSSPLGGGPQVELQGRLLVQAVQRGDAALGFQELRAADHHDGTAASAGQDNLGFLGGVPDHGGFDHLIGERIGFGIQGPGCGQRRGTQQEQGGPEQTHASR
ncbi:hypothetical protein [Deinococcus cellulosilyticus]|uniref:hypothetical protein n=1 Tax=Deinococcus cellulosilyticus TaxID=401558 RepID=UPI0011BEE9EE|nr:hypothetical protein [Deinococcus cellulosilyticus]